MKPIYRCEYCDKMDVEEEILKHEANCLYNYTRRSCFTCKNAENIITKFNCKAGKDIPEGQQFMNCEKYEWDEVDHTHKNPTAFNNLFGGIFG
jgi:hypothetical protein